LAIETFEKPHRAKKYQPWRYQKRRWFRRNQGFSKVSIGIALGYFDPKIDLLTP